MKFLKLLKTLFGLSRKKKKTDNLMDMLHAAGFEVGVRPGSETETINKEEYKYNHCFIFYGLNENAFTAIENQVEQFDGSRGLSFLWSMEGVLMTDFCIQESGSEEVKEAMKSNDDCIAYITQEFDQHLEKIKEHFNSQIGEDCVKLLNTEKPYIVDNIRYAMKVWSESEFFEKEEFIGAMLVFVRSSKEFNFNDELSENKDGMNLPLVERNGFIRSCICATEDVINVKYELDVDAIPKEMSEENKGINPRNKFAYGPAFKSFFHTNSFGFNYFDQSGQLWLISEVNKDVRLTTEDVTGTEYTVTY